MIKIYFEKISKYLKGSTEVFKKKIVLKKISKNSKIIKVLKKTFI